MVYNQSGSLVEKACMHAGQAIRQGVHPQYVQFLDIRVRRGSVLGDTLAQIESRRHELRKPLRVTFISGGVPEEGVDQALLSARCMAPPSQATSLLVLLACIEAGPALMHGWQKETTVHRGMRAGERGPCTPD